MKKIFYILVIIIIIINLIIVKKTKVVENISYDRDLEYFKEYFNNNDIIGKIKINDTNINDFLVKTYDNEYYLTHNLNKEYDIKGAIYVDYRTNLNSRQINIYGHNSLLYDLPFKTLERYLDKEFYLNHKYINIWDGNKDNIYLISSIEIVDDLEHMNLDITKEHIEKLNNSIYDTGEFINIYDDILILQTCNNDKKGSYIIVIAKKI